MAGRSQQGFSRTLPKNFTFSAGNEPRTPQRVSAWADIPPPPPRHSSCRVRRSRVRSGTDIFARADWDSNQFKAGLYDVPLPSIEVAPTPEAELSRSGPDSQAPVATSDRFLAPPRERLMLKTPPAQIRAALTDSKESPEPWTPWDHRNPGEPIQRPGSACSNASDSSVSTIETYASRRSVGGSCTSPESDIHDPFFYLEIPRKSVVQSTPVPDKKSKDKARDLPRKRRWTLEMDNHLWNTYQLYIQDPTITPFKMTPGSIPPLGVTHRVAREAKRAWDKRKSKAARPLQLDAQSRSGSTTPTTIKCTPARLFWPRSESSTRRRLKLLCQRKFSIAPHYQRMMESHSPEPPMDLFSRSSGQPSRAVVPENNTTAYATRDLGVSLASTSVPEPLLQLATEDLSHPATRTLAASFDHPAHLGSYPPSESTLMKRPASMGHPGQIPRLGSPFMYSTWGPERSRRRAHHLHTPMGRRETIHITNPRFRFPLPQMEAYPAMQTAVPQTQNSKPDSNATPSQEQQQHHQQQQQQDDDRHLENLLSQNKVSNIGPRRVRLRNRGATVSAINTRGLDQLFSPPSPFGQDDGRTTTDKPLPNPLLNINGESIKRLGSPFKLQAPRRSDGFRGHAPSLSDPFARNSKSPHKTTARPFPHSPGAQPTLPYNSTEERAPDAEQIRRQTFSTPFTQQW
ncbi:hypothetical protein ASPZODRAFT_69934 [Penicilliopsis zonata CBS 506.65]|uniref:Uncharacterized protein n=1 Tax=Penicilliopsis zonata CBS 506.65 TaxID=1073090 RepID=A0A1L9SE19_9EURO|nr:hypothetical protein ASPZODRAFT_69934 [Penicilliopsis zonata CBS 506.65]OJJ45421.1 hypothetical protein ASPZODRAFT_69934 [Penicilliopsis zonata CBS 506.65]